MSEMLPFNPVEFGEKIDALIKPIFDSMVEQYGKENLGPVDFHKGMAFVYDEEDGKFKWTAFTDHMSEEELAKHKAGGIQ